LSDLRKKVEILSDFKRLVPEVPKINYRLKSTTISNLHVKQNSNYSVKQKLGTLVRPFWRAAAPGLKPLCLPCARQSGSRPGQSALPTTGLTTRAFRRPLLLPNPRALEYSDDVVFLFHPPHLSYHLSGPLPDNSVIIVIVVSWSVM